MSPTFGSIGGAEPSTLTFKLRTIKQTVNSSVMHSEIQVIGDPDSSVAIAAVLAGVPASTAWGLVTREAGGILSSVGGIVTIQGNSTVAPLAGSTWNVRPIQSSQGDLRVTAYQSTAADLSVTAVQGTSPWVVAGASTVAPLAGSTWNVRPVQSSQGDLRITAYQSTIADLNATVAPLAGSTWRTQPGSTLWASSAGFHFDSSGGLQISGTITAGGSTGPLTISQLLDSSGGTVTAADSANQAIRVNVVAGAAGGSTIYTVSRVLDSSGGAAAVGDIVNSAIRVNVVTPVGQQAMAASFPVVIASNQTVVTVGGNKTNNLAAPGAAQVPVLPAIANTAVPSYTDGNQVLLSCDTGGALRIVHLDSSNATVKPGDSANNALRVNVVAGSAASTTVNVSSLAGAVIMRSSKADALVSVYQSTAADLNVTVAGYSTIVSVAAFPAGMVSTVAPSSGSSGVVVRQVWDVILTTASTNAFSASTSFSIQSSGAALRSYVTAYSILSTNAGPHRIKFYSSGTMTWPVVFAALTSGVSGANLSGSPYLFRTAASEALTLQIGSGASTIAGYQVGVSYFRAP